MIKKGNKHPKIDHKDYVFSEETIASLVELGLVLKEIHMDLEAKKNDIINNKNGKTTISGKENTV